MVASVVKTNVRFCERVDEDSREDPLETRVIIIDVRKKVGVGCVCRCYFTEVNRNGGMIY